MRNEITERIIDKHFVPTIVSNLFNRLNNVRVTTDNKVNSERTEKLGIFLLIIRYTKAVFRPPMREHDYNVGIFPCLFYILSNLVLIHQINKPRLIAWQVNAVCAIGIIKKRKCYIVFYIIFNSVITLLVLVNSKINNILLLFEIINFIHNALRAFIHNMIICAIENIKTCLNSSVANLLRRIKNRITRIFKFRAAQNGFLVNYGHIIFLDNGSNVFIKASIVVTSVLLLTCINQGVVNKIITNCAKSNLTVGISACRLSRFIIND